MSSKIHRTVQTTKDRTALVGFTVTVAPNMTASIKSVTQADGVSYAMATDGGMTVQGTSPGIVCVSASVGNEYQQLLSYAIAHTASVASNEWKLIPTNLDPKNRTYEFKFMRISGSNQIVDSPTTTQEFSFVGIVRNTGRSA